MSTSAALAPVTLPVHRPGTAGSVVVVDFVKFSGDRSAADLVAEAMPHHQVLRADPVGDLTDLGRSLTVDELTEAYASRVEQVAGTPTLVVGYCSAAPLATALATALSRTSAVEGAPAGGAPGEGGVPLLLITPGYPLPSHVVEDLVEIRTTLGRPDPGQVGELPTEVGPALAWVEDVLAADLTATAEAMGASPEEAEVLVVELGARYRAWLGYLVQASVSNPALPADVRVLAMPETWAAPPGGWPATSTVLPAPVGRDEFLSESAQGPVTAAVATLTEDLA